jgi:2,3-bisphosphoglycerate-independent phosphoglycerate mutase
MIVTADHGNLEMMRDPATGQAHTAHTVGPVPLVYFGARRAPARRAARCATSRRPARPAALAVPPEMTGRSLLEPR